MKLGRLTLGKLLAVSAGWGAEMARQLLRKAPELMRLRG